MSLTSHLNDSTSPLTQYLRKTYIYRTETLKRLKTAMSTLLHEPPTREAYPHWLIGSAIDYRIRFALEAPNLDHLVAGRGINEHARRYGYYGRDDHEEWFEYLDTFFPEKKPITAILSPEKERMLIRYCLILGHFESYMRGGELKIRPRGSVEKTLAIPWRDEVEDMYQLVQQFYKTCPQWIGCPVITNPLFPDADVIGGADGDVIINSCLYDFKTTKRRTPNDLWIYQMIGYLLLNDPKERTIQSCGFYFPRQGQVIQWDALAWLKHLTHNVAFSFERAREEFIGMAYEAAEFFRNQENPR